jgi:hypothetical protein
MHSNITFSWNPRGKLRINANRNREITGESWQAHGQFADCTPTRTPLIGRAGFFNNDQKESYDAQEGESV